MNEIEKAIKMVIEIKLLQLQINALRERINILFPPYHCAECDFETDSEKEAEEHKLFCVRYADR